eukprot:1373860-Amorphochlora_amoeboformis.AAC.1
MGKRNRARKRKLEKNKLNRHQFRAKREKKTYGEGLTIPVGETKRRNGGGKQGMGEDILIVGDGDFSFTRGLVRSR